MNNELSSQSEVHPGPPERDKDKTLNPEVNPGPPERDIPAYFLAEKNFPPLGKPGSRSYHNFFPKTQPLLRKHPPWRNQGHGATKNIFQKQNKIGLKSRNETD